MQSVGNSTVMKSVGNSGVWTRRVVYDVIITSWQPENSSQPMQCEATARLANVNEISNRTPECIPDAQPSNGGSQKKPGTLQPFTCELCKISCTRNEDLNVHLTGKKHLKKLQESEQIPNPSLTPIASMGTPVMDSLESMEGKSVISHEGKPDTLQPSTCELCKISCTRNEDLNVHLTGKKHLKKLQETSMGTPVMDSLESMEGKSVISHEGKPDTLQPFTCELCKISCSRNEDLNVHLTGKKHLKKLHESEQIPNPSLTHIASMGTPVMDSLESTEGKSVISHEAKRVWCDLCGVDCNTYDALRNHISGKKHQKKLEISERPIGPNPAPATMQNLLKEEGKVVNVDGGGNRKGKRVGNDDEDFETKKQKVL